MDNKRILIQGAMDVEVKYLIKNLEQYEKITVAGYDFYKGQINDLTLIISKTLMGVINSTIATTIGIIKFNPDIVINQGIAGSHRRDIHVGDIVIGKKCCNINSYSMPIKEKGEGSNPFEWNVNKGEDIKLADKKLVNMSQSLLVKYCKNNVYVGTVGSGDVFNREVDRIDWLNEKFNTDCEEMESVGTYTACDNFGVPCIGIRIISNNELTHEKLDEGQAMSLQELILKIIKNI